MGCKVGFCLKCKSKTWAWNGFIVDATIFGFLVSVALFFKKRDPIRYVKLPTYL